MTASTRTRLHRVPTPRNEPPYDDDAASRWPRSAQDPAWLQGSLALAIPAVDPGPRAPAHRRTLLRVVPDPPGDQDDPREVPCGDEDEPDHHPIPDVHQPWIARLAQALLEALTGERPHTQLLPWTSDKIYAAVTEQSVARARRRPNVDLTRRAPAYVRTVRVSKPRPEVAEVCALVRRGTRTQALALRLEAWRGRWRCTAFELA